MAYAAAREKQCADDAVIGLKGRLVLCLFGSRFFGAQRGEPVNEAQISQTIEAAEEGLSLIRRWQPDRRLTSLTQDLFRLGAEAYAYRQPQFLVEFLREHSPLARFVARNAEAQRIAARALTVAIAQVAREAFANLTRPRIQRILATFHELREAADRMGDIDDAFGLPESLRPTELGPPGARGPTRRGVKVA